MDVYVDLAVRAGADSVCIGDGDPDGKPSCSADRTYEVYWINDDPERGLATIEINFTNADAGRKQFVDEDFLDDLKCVVESGDEVFWEEIERAVKALPESAYIEGGILVLSEAAHDALVGWLQVDAYNPHA